MDELTSVRPLPSFGVVAFVVALGSGAVGAPLTPQHTHKTHDAARRRESGGGTLQRIFEPLDTVHRPVVVRSIAGRVSGKGVLSNCASELLCQEL